MLEIGDIKIYLCTGHTDMRKGINSLSALAAKVLKENFCKMGWPRILSIL